MEAVREASPSFPFGSFWEPTLNQMRKEIDWSKPSAKADAEALTRRLALQYVSGYLEGGDSRLAVYRDSARATFVAAEFKAMVDRMPSLTEYLPELKQYLLGFPKATLPNSESFLYWQEAKFGLKPTIRINHVVISEQATHAVVASKMIYSSHYFWTALELRVLVPASYEALFEVVAENWRPIGLDVRAVAVDADSEAILSRIKRQRPGIDAIFADALTLDRVKNDPDAAEKLGETIATV